MNENEVDNTENKIIESDVIETEVSTDSGQQQDSELKTENTDDSKPQTVIIKKGSFLAFLAFIFSLAALAACAYIYYHINNSTSQTTEVNTWQAPLSKLDKKFSQQVTNLSQQLQAIENNNQGLTTQLKALGATFQTIQLEKGTEDAKDTINQEFDDTAIKQQLSSLQSTISQQDQRINQLQDNITTNQQKQSQNIQQFRQKLNSQALTVQTPVTTENTYIYEKAVSLLQAAHIQLNINANVKKAQALLSKTQQQLKKLPAVEFKQLADELQTVISELKNNQQNDHSQLMQQLEKLTEAGKQLKFTSKKQENKPDSSWYDKLIVIRKIDQQQAAKLTISDQQAILNTIKTDYQMLKIALINQDQGLWRSKIDKIEKTLNKYFADSEQIQQLKSLKSREIKTEYPDLETYLNKLKSFQQTVAGIGE